jgi:hypothetical protein
MKTLKIIAFVFGLGLAFGACKNPVESEATTDLPPALFKEWLTSYEEDAKDGLLVYRPAGFAFPPSRGRTGFTIDRSALNEKLEIQLSFSSCTGGVDVHHWHGSAHSSVQL